MHLPIGHDAGIVSSEAYGKYRPFEKFSETLLPELLKGGTQCDAPGRDTMLSYHSCNSLGDRTQVAFPRPYTV